METSKRKPTPLTREQKIRKYMKKYFGSQWKNAWRVAKAENSSLSDHAQCFNRNSIDTGVMQINDYWHWKKFASSKVQFREKLKNTKYNIKIASLIYEDSGWTAWTTVKNGRAKIK